MKVFVKELAPYKKLYRDSKTGIAWVEDGSSGMGHSCHPNISTTGSIRGMKQLGYWRKDDRVVRSHGFYYNVDSFVADDELDWVAAENCQCGGVHRQR